MEAYLENGKNVAKGVVDYIENDNDTGNWIIEDWERAISNRLEAMSDCCAENDVCDLGAFLIHFLTNDSYELAGLVIRGFVYEFAYYVWNEKKIANEFDAELNLFEGEQS